MNLMSNSFVWCRWGGTACCCYVVWIRGFPRIFLLIFRSFAARYLQSDICIFNINGGLKWGVMNLSLLLILKHLYIIVPNFDFFCRLHFMPWDLPHISQNSGTSFRIEWEARGPTWPSIFEWKRMYGWEQDAYLASLLNTMRWSITKGRRIRSSWPQDPTWPTIKGNSLASAP